MDKILINHMYTGDFLKKDNLGHEIINLFKCDNGNHYIYAMSAGDYAAKHRNEIKKVLLVHNIDEKTAQILAIADVEEDIFGNMIKDGYVMLPGIKELEDGFMSKNSARVQTYKDNHKKQLEYIEDNDVKYGGVRLDQLYKTNFVDSLGHTIYLTFRVKNFRKPKNNIYLCDERYKSEDPHCFILKGCKRMGGSSVATLVSLDCDTIRSLSDINNKDLWEEKDTSEKVNPKNLFVNDICFLDVAKKRNDEVVYSNLIAYFLKNDKDLLRKFANNVLKIDTPMDNVRIVRESEDNIDIFIEDSKSIIVIENKIKSKINGEVERDLQDQDKKDKKLSQLSKYYAYASAVAAKYDPKKEIYCFILFPNYVYKTENDLKSLKDYKDFDKYTTLRYSQLSDYFEKEKKKVKLPFYDEFLKALRIQSQDWCGDLYAKTMDLFVSAIRLNGSRQDKTNHPKEK